MTATIAVAAYSSSLLICCIVGTAIVNFSGDAGIQRVVLNMHIVWFGFLSIAAEGLGLVVLRARIASRGNVYGISGQTVTAVVAMLSIKAATQFPAFNVSLLLLWVFKLFEVVSLVVAADIARCIFVTYRSTYDIDSDIVPMKFVLAASTVFTFVCTLTDGHGLPLGSGSSFLVSVESLVWLPQIVMMAKQSSFVAPPIAHYVAANALGKFMDLCFWCEEFDIFNNFHKLGFNGWYIIGSQVVGLAFVSDFFYFYVRAMLKKSSTEDVLCM